MHTYIYTVPVKTIQMDFFLSSLILNNNNYLPNSSHCFQILTFSILSCILLHNYLHKMPISSCPCLVTEVICSDLRHFKRLKSNIPVQAPTLPKPEFPGFPWLPSWSFSPPRQSSTLINPKHQVQCLRQSRCSINISFVKLVNPKFLFILFHTPGTLSSPLLQLCKLYMTFSNLNQKPPPL